MRNAEPGKAMTGILKQFNTKVVYLEGNPLSHKDLKRSMADSASCCVVLSNKFCRDPIIEDYRNILQSFAVKQYAQMKRRREIRLCLQLVKPEHKDLYYSGLHSTVKIDQVLCVEQLKLQLLAKSCVCQGTITIIWSLITSNTPKALQNQSELKEWEKNYLHGMKYELYRVPLKQKVFVGFKFKDVAIILYQKLNLILVALEVRIGNHLKVFVNPAEYVFEPIDHHGYVIDHENPDYNEINGLNLDKGNNENFFIMEYLNKKE